MTLGYALGFQHSPRNLANVSEWIITFDPILKTITKQRSGLDKYNMSGSVDHREVKERQRNLVHTRIIR